MADDIPDGLKADVGRFSGKKDDNGNVVADKVSPSSLIQLGDNVQNFARMQGAEDLNVLKMTNPNASYHELTRRAFGWHDDSREGAFEAVLDSATQPRATRRNIAAQAMIEFVDGSTVKDRKLRRKGIIIKACVGYSKKNHIPAHRIADSQGNTWVAKETDLKLIG